MKVWHISFILRIISLPLLIGEKERTQRKRDLKYLFRCRVFLIF